jgi:hypothetical protein
VVAALEAGKHVFCEKPLCRTLEQARAIARVRGDRHLACNLILRAAPLYSWLRDAIRAGELGEIYAFDGDYLYGRLHKITEGWRGTVDDYSVFQGGAVHLVDLMVWLLGERPARVAAVGNRIVTRDTAFRYPDFVAATYELPSGVIGRITANFGCILPPARGARVRTRDVHPRRRRGAAHVVTGDRPMIEPRPSPREQGDPCPSSSMIFAGSIPVRRPPPARCDHRVSHDLALASAVQSIGAGPTFRSEGRYHRRRSRGRDARAQAYLTHGPVQDRSEFARSSARAHCISVVHGGAHPRVPALQARPGTGHRARMHASPSRDRGVGTRRCSSIGSDRRHLTARASRPR